MRRFGLVGKTLSHSFSKTYFANKFTAEGIVDCSYENYELQTIDAFPALLQTAGLEGLNVTIPYKEEVIPFLDVVHEAVEAIGACNCIRIRGGRAEGFNTDAPAFEQCLKNVLQHHHSRALVLGSGGASKAVQYALKQLGLGFRVVSRLASGDTVAYEELNASIIGEHQVIINTTPLGMYPKVDEYPPIPYPFLNESHLLFDLTYNPDKTRFLLLGEERGAQIMNGYGMLVLQAEESWRIWNSDR